MIIFYDSSDKEALPTGCIIPMILFLIVGIVLAFIHG